MTQIILFICAMIGIYYNADTKIEAILILSTQNLIFALLNSYEIEKLSDKIIDLKFHKKGY